MRKEEKINFLIDESIIAKVLGAENFTSDEAAILELIKNAYDAMAINLTITFKDDKIIIKDDGNGMTKDVVEKKWMHVGFGNEEYEMVDDNKNKRIISGAKGVGRFALAKLGSTAKMYTKSNNKTCVEWRTNWKETYIAEDSEKKEKGTTFIIGGLYEKWGNNKIENLKKYISRTYRDKSMKIFLEYDNTKIEIQSYSLKGKPGIDCKSVMKIVVKNGTLNINILSDEFMNKANKVCKGIDIQNCKKKIILKDEFNEIDNVEDKLKKVGNFEAKLCFNFNAIESDVERFMYKYKEVKNDYPDGIILFRNSFTISNYDGKKDWLELNKRARGSAAATHETGRWRVRGNQLFGYVLIDKIENKDIKELSNRQGIVEDEIYEFFVEIIHAGINEFEMYRQSIIRALTKKEKENVDEDELLEKFLKAYSIIKTLSNEQLKRLRKEIINIVKQKDEIEEKHRYDLGILNVLATIGLKASSISHRIINQKSQLLANYQYIIDALKKYKMWDELNSYDKTQRSYENVPKMLNDNNVIDRDIIEFMSIILEKIEKKQFVIDNLSIRDILLEIISKWQKEHKNLHINLKVKKEVEFITSKDKIRVIFDNLILNSYQQNENIQINIDIEIDKHDKILDVIYKDSGRGLAPKYINNPRRILEVHETTRINGHGLGMWIVNNTINILNGNINDINGKSGFYFNFEIEEEKYER